MRKIVLLIIVVHSLLSAQMSSSAKSKLQSLIIAGMGELKMGHENRARSSFIREVALWLICIGGKHASNWYESDYRAFAELHEDVQKSFNSSVSRERQLTRVDASIEEETRDKGVDVEPLVAQDTTRDSGDSEST